MGVMQVARLVGLVAALGMLAACSSNPARTAMNLPLHIPEPPPRVVMDPTPTPEPPSATVPVSASRPTASIPTAIAAGTAATAVPTPQEAPVVQAVEPVRTTPPDLRPVNPAGRLTTDSQVRDGITRARQKLDAIDRRRLNAGQRTDYESALRFLEQAEAALKASNLLLAESSVEKADTLANGLRR
jgi:hypothetical protein